MHLTKTERQRLKDQILGLYCDWSRVEPALKAKNLRLSKSSFDRFIAGTSNSPRTLSKLAALLGTTSEALVNQIRMLRHGPLQAPEGSFAAVKPLRDPEAFRIAFQLWVEMTTRKLGLLIDPTQDSVAECYDSWYAFFKSARELIKTIPLHKNPRSAELRQLVQISQAVLNDGIRPHLQRWQARFRNWAANSGDRAKSPGLSPQEAQQLFPEWPALRDDLLATNQRLISYVCALDVMVARPVAPQPAGKRLPRRIGPPQFTETARGS